MRRTAGLAMNPNTGRMELSCEDEKMAEILVNMGIVGSDDEAIKVFFLYYQYTVLIISDAQRQTKALENRFCH